MTETDIKKGAEAISKLKAELEAMKKSAGRAEILAAVNRGLTDLNALMSRPS